MDLLEPGLGESRPESICELQPALGDLGWLDDPGVGPDWDRALGELMPGRSARGELIPGRGDTEALGRGEPVGRGDTWPDGWGLGDTWPEVTVAAGGLRALPRFSLSCSHCK